MGFSNRTQRFTGSNYLDVDSPFTIASKDIWLMSGYGPQDCWKLEEKMPFYTAVEEKNSRAENVGKSIVISFDVNS